MFSRIFSFISLAGLGVLTSSFLLSSMAVAAEDTRSQIESEIKKRHPQELNHSSSEFWLGLPADAPQVLLKMLSENPGTIKRARLIEGLGHFQSDEISKLLKSEIEKTKNNVLKKKLLSSLIHSEGPRALDYVENYLNSPDPNIRKEVARSLQSFALSGEGSSLVEEKLEKFKLTEKEEWVKDIHDSSWEGTFEGTLIGPAETKKSKITLEWPKNTEKTMGRRDWTVSIEGISLKSNQRIELKFFRTNKWQWVEAKIHELDRVFIASKPLKP